MVMLIFVIMHVKLCIYHVYKFGFTELQDSSTNILHIGQTDSGIFSP